MEEYCGSPNADASCVVAPETLKVQLSGTPSLGFRLVRAHLNRLEDTGMGVIESLCIRFGKA